MEADSNPDISLDDVSGETDDTVDTGGDTDDALDSGVDAHDTGDVFEIDLSPPTVIPSPLSNVDVATCEAEATAPDGSSLPVTYAWSNETTMVGLGTQPEITLTPSDVSPGDTLRCTATASDGTLTASDFVDVIVDPPVPGPCGSPRENGCSETHPRLGSLRHVPAGSFTMGCVAGRDDVAGGCFPLESPSRTVTLTAPFWMMESELTQAQWTGLGFDNPSLNVANMKPVERVNWWEALEAANELSRREGLAECYELSGCSSATSGQEAMGGGCVGTTVCVSGVFTCADVSVTSPSGHPKDCEGWRLPTEAEWEYAARAGTDHPYSGGSDVDDVAWFFGNNVPNGTKRVCTAPKPRNAWGLCDLSGNVWEWTWDRFADDYAGAATMNPVGPPSGGPRVFRGGGWAVVARGVRVASRGSNPTGSRYVNLGFRLVRSAP